MRSAVRRVLPWLLVGTVALAVTLLAGRPGQGVAFDPSGTGPLGMKALVDVLRELGGDVEVVDGAPRRSGGTLLVANDRYDDELRERILAWVGGGGTLVLTDVRSPMNPVRRIGLASLGTVGDVTGRPHCETPVATGVEEIVVPELTGLEADSEPRCFPVGDGHGLVVVERGAGELVVLGAAGIVTNQTLGKGDNAVLLTNLLLPQRGSGVAVLGLPRPGTGERGLLDLVPDRVWGALAQLGIAFVVLAWWRGRRLGDPVLEAQPTDIPGSELVVAAGQLLQRNRRRDDAAQILAGGLRDDLAGTSGMPATSPTDVLAGAHAARTGVDRSQIERALEPPPMASDEDLARYARTVERVRRETLGIRGQGDEPRWRENDMSTNTHSGMETT